MITLVTFSSAWSLSEARLFNMHRGRTSLVGFVYRARPCFPLCHSTISPPADNRRCNIADEKSALFRGPALEGGGGRMLSTEHPVRGLCSHCRRWDLLTFYRLLFDLSYAPLRVLPGNPVVVAASCPPHNPLHTSNFTRAA